MADDLVPTVGLQKDGCDHSGGKGGGGGGGGVEISASVGQFGTNLKPDVLAIQQALNSLTPQQGGPAKPLKEDGASGPFTIKAILDFQKFHRLPNADGRVDPGKPTIIRLNELSNSVATQGARRGGIGPRGLPLPPNPSLIAALVTLVPDVRRAIRAADFNCSMVDNLITPTGIRTPTTEAERVALAKIDGAFGLGFLRSPRQAFDNIQVVYRNMVVALNRTFETDPLVAKLLFVSNPDAIHDQEYLAFTSAGGAFLNNSVKLQHSGLPANRIYICNPMQQETRVEQIRVMIHELAHYVSGRPFLVTDQIKAGSSLQIADAARYAVLQPMQKVQSAEHYAFFAVMSLGIAKLDGPPIVIN